MLVHNDTCNPTHDARVDVVCVGKLVREHSKRRGSANGAIHVLVVGLIALRCSHGCETCLERHFQKRDRGEGVEGVVVLSELFDELVPSSSIVQILR